MPLPSQNDLHVSRVLTDYSVKFMRAQSDFIGEKIFPTMPVTQAHNTFVTYNRADWFRETAERRAPGTESAGGGWRVGKDTYDTTPWALHKDVSDPERANADSIWSLDTDSTEYVTRQLLSSLENQVLTSIFAASVWTGASTGNDQTGVSGVPTADQFKQWDDISSTPIELIRTFMREIHQQTGMIPNTLVMGPKVADTILDHADLIERVKYVSKESVTLELFGALIGIPRVLEAKYTRVTTAEQASSDTYAYQAGTGMWLGFVEPNPGIKKATAGLTFSWTGLNGTAGIEGFGTGVRIKKFRMEHLESDRVEGQFAIDVKRVGPILGLRFATVTG